jgi:hypothetical protein
MRDTYFALEQYLYMYGKWIESWPHEGGGRRPKIRHAIQALHSQTTNELLAAGDYKTAPREAKQAWRASPNVRHLAKWAMAWIVPRIARRVFGNKALTAYD